MASPVGRCWASLIVCSFGAYGQLAQAHAGLVSSDPGRRAALTVPPKEIRLCFNENIEAKFSAVTLSQADKATVSLGEIQIDPKAPACLIVALVSPLGNGSYTVRYRVLSVDGHVIEYGYGFELKTP